MSTSRSESILARHRYRPLAELIMPLVMLAAVALTAIGVTAAGASDARMILDRSILDREAPAVSAECVHLAGAELAPS